MSRLKFNCSGGLVPREIYNYEDVDNVTLLVAEITQVLIVNRYSVVLCICVATGYNGQVIRSRAAAVQKACKCIKYLHVVLDLFLEYSARTFNHFLAS